MSKRDERFYIGDAQTPDEVLSQHRHAPRPTESESSVEADSRHPGVLVSAPGKRVGSAPSAGGSPSEVPFKRPVKVVPNSVGDYLEIRDANGDTVTGPFWTREHPDFIAAAINAYTPAPEGANEYTPWIDMGITEVAYWKRRYLEARGREAPEGAEDEDAQIVEGALIAYPGSEERYERAVAALDRLRARLRTPKGSEHER